MQSLEADYSAVVVGASGGLGSAFADQLDADPRCARVFRLHRASEPALDVTDEASIAAAAGYLAAQAGNVRLILDATGVLSIGDQRPEKSLKELDPAVMAQSFAVNAVGPALLMKHLVAVLPRRKRSVFATLSARIGSIEDNRRGGWISYRAAKAALNQIVRTTALEWRGKRPQCVCVGLQPGTVATSLSAPFRKPDDPGVLSPAKSARRLLAVLDGLGPDASGGHYDHAGDRIPG